MKRFESLDAFRGLCAVAVVLFHTHIVGSITEWRFFKGSAVLVEFFFVLSGFVLAHGYGFRENLPFKPFIKARIFRIFPLHIVMLAIMILLEFCKLFAAKFAGLSFNNQPFSGPGAISEMIPNLLLLHAWTPLTDPLSFNYTAWSISIEFYMYILLFLSICVFKEKKTLAWLLVSTVMLYGVYIESSILTSEVFLGLSCFFGGAFMYTLYKKIEHIKVGFTLASIIELTALIAVISVVCSDLDNRTVYAILLFFFVVTVFAFDAGIISQMLKKKPFQVAGTLSYSIYMIHGALLFCLISAMMVLQKITGIEMTFMMNDYRYLSLGNTWLNNGLAIAIVAMVLFFSHFTYKYIELKGLQLGKKK